MPAKSPLTLHIIVDDGVTPWRSFKTWARQVGDLVAAYVPAYAESPRPCTVTLRLASNDTVQGLNKQFRKKDKPTNVLSFPNDDDGLEAAWHVGDIILAQGVVEDEVDTTGRPLANHTRHLMLHGLLHLVGYDHETPRDANVMEKLERTLLSLLDIPNPYAID